MAVSTGKKIITVSRRRGNINHATIEANGCTQRKKPRMPSDRQVLPPILPQKKSTAPVVSSFEVVSLLSIELFPILILTIMFSPNSLAIRQRSPTTEENIFSQKRVG